MKNPVICKACGLVIEEGRLGDVCPACGVPRNAFQPYKETVSDRRLRILNLHLHPIMVHFPQAFTGIIPVLLILSVFFYQAYDEFLSTARVLAFFLPLTVLASIASGMIDGRVRFKKLTTPYLVKKILLGTALLAITLAMCAVSLLWNGMDHPLVAMLILSLFCIPLQVLLGITGIKLMFSRLPG